MTKPLTLVLGATGKTGRRVAAALEARDLPVRRGSRSASPRFDWDDAATWPAVLEGVEQVYIAFQPDLAFPGATETIRRFSDLAVERGVDKLVLLSGRGEEAAQRCEGIVMESGARWTIVRASWFAQNFDEGHFVDAIREGVLPLPIAPVAEPFIDVDDIAKVAVAALTDPKHDGEVYEVTGPRLLTFADALGAIGEATDRSLRVVQLPPDVYRQAAVEAGVPDALAAFYVELMQMTLDGRNARVTDGVERALGRPARDFDDYVREAARAGAWS